MNLEEYKKYVEELTLEDLYDIKLNIDQVSNPKKFEYVLNRISYLEEKKRISGSTQKEKPEEQRRKNPNWIAGIGPRLLALFIDSIVLGILGLIIIFLFDELIVQLGSKARLIGFGVALGYFSILNSTIGHGQTFGKRVVGIQVVDLNGFNLKLSRSFARHFVLLAPYFFNGMFFESSLLGVPITLILWFIVFGGSFSIIYLFLFNRSRQSLHDLLVKSVVINPSAEKREPPIVWRPHLYVTACIFLLSIVIPAVLYAKGKNTPPSSNSTESSQIELEEFDCVFGYTLFQGTGTFFSSSTTTETMRYLGAKVFLIEDDVMNEELANSISEILAEGNSNNEYDEIQVILIYAIDIGIASRANSHVYRFNQRKAEKEFGKDT